MTNDKTIRAGILFICFVLAIYGLHVTQNLLAPFALAVFFWLIIDAFARWIDNLSSKIPYWFALSIALLVVVLGIAGVIIVIADTANDIARDVPRYKARLGEIFEWVGRITRQDDWTVSSLDNRFGISDKIQSIVLGLAASVQGVLSNFMIIAIYVIFLFAAQSSFPKKMDDLFPDMNGRARAQKVVLRIRESVEKYVGVQTLMSLIQTVLSYIVMLAFGLDNALFWAMVIFILNFIPIIGGVLAIILPLLFAVVQFESVTKFGGLAGGLVLVQFVINNTLQPKMMGDSMNMSALVVVLSLTLWGALWGGVGMFLAAPLTVIIMIVLAQFPSTRWISVLLSADGHPDMDEHEKKRQEAKPGM